MPSSAASSLQGPSLASLLVGQAPDVLGSTHTWLLAGTGQPAGSSCCRPTSTLATLPLRPTTRPPAIRSTWGAQTAVRRPRLAIPTCLLAESFPVVHKPLPKVVSTASQNAGTGSISAVTEHPSALGAGGIPAPLSARCRGLASVRAALASGWAAWCSSALPSATAPAGQGAPCKRRRPLPARHFPSEAAAPAC